MHFCNCKYKRSLVLSPLRSLLIFHSLPRWALAPPSSTVKKKKKIAPGDPILNRDNRMGVQRAEACSPRWLRGGRSLWCFWPQISVLLHYGWQRGVTGERTLLICPRRRQPRRHLAAAAHQATDRTLLRSRRRPRMLQISPEWLCAWCSNQVAGFIQSNWHYDSIL